jgi:hypothetical protein
MPFTEIDRLLLNSRQAEISMELKLFKLKQHVEDELSQINSRLCELEAQVTTLKEKEGGNIVIFEPIDTKVGT